MAKRRLKFFLVKSPARIAAAIGMLVVAILASKPAAAEYSADNSIVPQAERYLATLPALVECLPSSASEQAMLADAADGRWQTFDLLTAALITERHSAADERRLARRLDEHAAAARRQLASAPNVAAAETLFAYLHQHILTGRFSADCNAVGQTLETGRFNCLSGTILFVGLAQRCGVPSQAVLAPSHVYARTLSRGVPSGERAENVETTCPTWFDQSAPRREAWLCAVLGDESSTDRHRPLSSVELLAVVYYNRGVEHFALRDFPAAAADNLVALRLDSRNAPAADNLLAAVNNWALAAARQGQFDLAGELIRRGRHVAPDRRDLQASQRYVAGRQHVPSHQRPHRDATFVNVGPD